MKEAFPRHVIQRIKYAQEQIDCTCGAVITAEPDDLFHDRHLPLAEAFAAHRMEAGARLKLFRPSIYPVAHRGAELRAAERAAAPAAMVRTR